MHAFQAYFYPSTLPVGRLPQAGPGWLRLEPPSGGRACLLTCQTSGRADRVQTAAAGDVWVILVGHAAHLSQPTLQPADWLAHWLADGRNAGAALAQFEGEFCLLAWDCARRQVLMACDRVGHRMLYYSQSQAPGEPLICASQAVFALSAAARLEIDPQALNLYFSLRGVPAPYSLLAGVRKVMPGQWITRSPEGEKTGTWWDAASLVSDSAESGLEEMTRNLDATLSAAVQRANGQAIFLSGGLDSGILAGLSRRAGRDLKAFTVGYTPPFPGDETGPAAIAASQLGLGIQVERLSLDELPHLLEQVLAGLPEPVVDPSFLPQLYLARQMGAQVEAVLDGTGADGLFGGSNKMLAQGYRRFYRALPRTVRRRLVMPLLDLLPSSRRSPVADMVRKAQIFAAGSELPELAAEVLWSRLMPASLLQRLLRPPYRLPGDLPGDLLAAELARFGGRHALAGVALMNLRLIQPWYELHKHSAIEDQTGLSIRTPFLAPDVIGLALAMPDEFKLHALQGKYILYKAFAEIAPGLTLQRRKHNFSPPLSLWLQRPLRPAFEDTMRSSVFCEPDVLQQLDRQHASGRRDWQTELWSVFMLERWWSAVLAAPRGQGL